jgi:hypothetical protein
MEKEKRILTANILRNIARYTLLVLGVLVFIFALFSGSEDYGGGIRGIIQNSPNALPWLILLILIFIAWKWELVGGIIITLLGIAMLFFFVLLGNNFFLITFILTLLIIMLGSFFIISWYLRKDKR